MQALYNTYILANPAGGALYIVIGAPRFIGVIYCSG